MIRITRGYYGNMLKYKRGDTISLSQDEEKRLVERNVAEYVNETIDTSNEDITVTDAELVNEDDYFLSEDEIRSMKKQDLIDYAARIGVPNFEDKATNSIMIDTILNFIEENSEGVMSNGV